MDNLAADDLNGLLLGSLSSPIKEGSLCIISGHEYRYLNGEWAALSVTESVLWEPLPWWARWFWTLRFKLTGKCREE